MTIGRQVFTALEVADLARSLRFYRDLVGIPLEPGKSQAGDDRWLAGDHGEISWRDGPYLHFALFQAKDAVTRDVQIGFSVTDLDAAHARLLEAGAATIHEPREEPWGRTARYRDPDGNVVSLTEMKRR